MAFIYHKNFAKVFLKKWKSKYFSTEENFLSLKKPKSLMNFLQPTKFRWGQKRTKNQMKLFSPTNLKQDHIIEDWPKKGQTSNPGIQGHE